LNGLVAHADCDPALVEDVILGCVSQAGEQSNNVARNVVLASNLPESVSACSIDRQCGSSQQALQFAAQAVMSGTMDVVIAAGVESMSRVPMFTPSTLAKKNGMGFYFSPGMELRYPGVGEFSQFTGAEMVARKYELSREQLDQFAYQSHQRAIAATKAGFFTDEILPVSVKSAGVESSEELHLIDEGIRFDASLEGISSVKLMAEGGRCTAANSSQICDGASGVLVVSERALKVLGVKPLARVHHLSVFGHDPVIMLEAPIPATARALEKAGLKINDIDLFEINEAFASIPLAWLQATGADPGRLNVNGGAIALGHPLGASGTKLASTLIHALHKRGGRYGLQSMCEGGGMANVTIFEKL
jgi:acetyl-CoA C-acetyltransferase